MLIHSLEGKKNNKKTFFPNPEVSVTNPQNKTTHAFLPVTFLSGPLCFKPPGDDAMTGDTDKYLAPQDLRELGDDSLPQEGYMGFSVGARSQR